MKTLYRCVVRIGKVNGREANQPPILKKLPPKRVVQLTRSKTLIAILLHLKLQQNQHLLNQHLLNQLLKLQLKLRLNRIKLPRIKLLKIRQQLML